MNRTEKDKKSSVARVRRAHVFGQSNNALLARQAEKGYDEEKGVDCMETKDVLAEIRGKHNLTQEQMAEKLYVTRQAVSRWETGETIPNTETLKRISREFGVSINTLLGSPQKLICQCCGMPLEDENISRETDGTFNEEYCKWCYAEGKFVYSSLEELMDFLGKHMSSDQWPEEAVRAFLQQTLPTLRHWRQD